MRAGSRLRSKACAREARRLTAENDYAHLRTSSKTAGPWSREQERQRRTSGFGGRRHDRAATAPFAGRVFDSTWERLCAAPVRAHAYAPPRNAYTRRRRSRCRPGWLASARAWQRVSVVRFFRRLAEDIELSAHIMRRSRRDAIRKTLAEPLNLFRVQTLKTILTRDAGGAASTFARVGKLQAFLIPPELGEEK